MKTCDFCDGNGYYLIEDIEDTKVTCEVCGGSGEITSMKQEVWIDVDGDTHEYDCEIHIHGADIFEILEGLNIIRERIHEEHGFDFK